MAEEELEFKLAEVQKNSEYWYAKYKELQEHHKKVCEELTNTQGVTMFEKEAKAYFRENAHCFDEETACRECMEFGYNKANEWHYPSKGELPKEDKDMLMSKTLLLITKMKGSDCLSLALGEYNFSTQEFSYQHIVGLTDVIAWKEIVLPELKESE